MKPVTTLRRQADGDDWQEVGRTSGNAASFHDQSVDPDAWYYYRVTATQNGAPVEGTRTEDHNNVLANDYPHLTRPTTQAADHDALRNGPFVMRTIEMNAPHAYVEIDFRADVGIDPAHVGDAWARVRVRATANGDLLYEKLVWIDPDTGAPRSEEKYGYPQSSEPCRCKGQPPHHKVLYPTQSDDVTVRIEAGGEPPPVAAE